MKEILAAPFRDVGSGLSRCLEPGPIGLLRIGLGLLAGWSLYVPIHELLHAAGCLLAGGDVSRIEISPIYGGQLLARVLDRVTATGEYAGRLSGFDTHGNDLTYLVTDLTPFVLTIFPGVSAIRRAGTAGRAFLFGFALPLGLAPFLSLTGNAYEIGSILVSHLAPWSHSDLASLLRGDDLFRVAGAVHRDARTSAWIGLGLGASLGACWAWLTYLLGAAISRVPSFFLPHQLAASSRWRVRVRLGRAPTKKDSN